MLKNFLIIAFRNLLKNKVYVAINIVGLGLALACCIVAYLNTKYNIDFDKNHAQIDHIYKIHSIRENQGDLHEYGRIPMPMAPAIRNDLSGASRVFRFESHVFSARDVNMDKIFNTSVCYAEPGFMESFTFPAVSGDPLAYQQLENAVVTKEYANKFYGDEDPIGKVLTVFDDTGMSFNFTIGGVVEKAPQNSSVHFEVLVSFENRFRMYDDNVKGNWEAFAQNTFLYFDQPEQADAFEGLLDKYIPIQNAARQDFIVSSFVLSPMNNHAHISNDIRWDNLRDAMPTAAVLTPQVMALLILLVACFNFTNTAIANSNRRLKEIGIRKVLGGSRRQLIQQFMTENLAVCFLALITSIGIALYLVPMYSAMWEGMELQLELMEDFTFYMFLAGLLIFTTMLAGLYPSLYISKYRPVNILRGSMSIGGAGKLTRFLLATQYTFTVIALFASVAFIQNARYQDTLDLGYERNQVIGVSLLNDTQYQKILAAMEANPAIESVASAKNHIGRGNYGGLLKNGDQEVNVDMLDVGINYIETMGLEVVQGRPFQKELEASDSRNSIVVNEKLVEAFDWVDPIGQRLVVDDSTTLTVVGVVKNFYMYGFWAPLEPVGIRLKSLKFEDDGTYSFMVARTNISNVKEVYSYLEESWNAKIPTKTFAGFYQDDLLRNAREVNNNILTIFGFLGIVAFILSSLGLFTLVSINLIRRTKEIGVRKVLGGGLGHIVFLISRGYAILLVIASVVGVTMGYYLIDGLIASIFRNYKDMDVFTFLIPAIVIISISLTIAGLRTLKAAMVNPVQSLRYE
ncbi:ABC transporter permease [Marinoscillum furvescens]|uniref:ABC-type lipoprotein release transport system permease subunit n=1 Tax=Marinoscillum furvescens DSM 4134 TaxID=1122208 RepID=A0A3D9L4P5_MARFU|nr:ABC transporter permease [Marinoscillum furvescens]RED97910.1 ABC-type lipoprotein release transport system permease subunit [Marinoscillum furvescens DSM 4134]